MDYIAYLHKERKSNFGVSFPDFPGCVTGGKTLEEARRMAAEALSFHVEGMVHGGCSCLGLRMRRIGWRGFVSALSLSFCSVSS